MAFWPRNPKWTHQLPQPYHLEVLIDQNQTEGEQHPDGVDCVGWHDPDAAIRLQGPATKQANQPPQYGVCYLDSKGQGSPGLVIDKDVPLLFEHTWSFHEVGSLNLVRCFFLHPVYQREENDDCKHARYDANQCYVIHFSPLLELNCQNQNFLLPKVLEMLCNRNNRGTEQHCTHCRSDKQREWKQQLNGCLGR